MDWLNARAEDTARHVADLRSGTYEGAESRAVLGLDPVAALTSERC
jgi:hypothetical protein